MDISIPIEELAERLTLAGMEVEHIEYYGVAPTSMAASHGTAEAANSVQHDGLVWDREKIVIAQIVEVKAHPNADRLRVCQVDVGEGDARQIVFSAIAQDEREWLCPRRVRASPFPGKRPRSFRSRRTTKR